MNFRLAPLAGVFLVVLSAGCASTGPSSAPPAPATTPSPTAARLVGLTDRDPLQGTVEDSALVHVRARRPALGLTGRDDFSVTSVRTGAGGLRHVRMQQTVDGIPVWASDIVVHADDHEIRGVDGMVTTGLGGFQTAPRRIDAAGAIGIAEAAYARRAAPGSALAYSRESAELVVLPMDMAGARLAWHVTFFTELQGGLVPGLWNTFVDADTGVVLRRFNGIDTVVQASGPGGNAKVSRYWTSQLDTEPSGAQYTMDTTRLQTTDMQHLTSGNGVIVVGPLDPISDAPIDDAHGFAEVTLNMLQDWMGYTSIDNAGFKIRSRVHYSSGYENAFWDGTQMTYGDGASTFYPLSGDVDVVAHEIDHGFTSFHSNLVYSGMSGGMNESFSDVAGTIAEFYSEGAGADWNIGTDIFRSPTGALRYMCNPTQDGISIDNAANYAGQDVHYTSGVYNKAFCRASRRLATGDPNGAATPDSVHRAGKAWYEANANYWVSGSTFLQGCHGVLNAATALGYSPTEIQAISDSFVDVGLACNDNAPPTVSITSPANGSSVTGAVTLQANASDDTGVTQVEFYVGSSLAGTDTTSPYSIVWDSSSLVDGSYAIVARAYDAGGNITPSAPVTVTVTNPGGAGWDPTLKAPLCAAPAASCNSRSLTVGRANLGPEPNQPNTIFNSCADGTSGGFHSDESLDRLAVVSLDGGNFAPGKQVRIDATAWVWSGYTSDHLDLYYAADASAPVWTYLTTITPPAAGLQTMSYTYTLPAGGARQAVRGNFRYVGSSAPCTTGAFDDRDDLVFTIVPPGPSIAIVSPSNGAIVTGPTTVSANANDPAGITEVDFFDGGTPIGSATSAPWQVPWSPASAGSHALAAQMIGGSGTLASAPVPVTVDLAAPTVAITAPSAGAQLRGTVTVSAAAGDDVGVSKVQFYAGSTLIGTANAAPFSIAWNTAGTGDGPKSLTAVAFDVANRTSTSGAVPVSVDDTAPSVSISAPTPGSFVSGTVPVTGIASDASGIAHVEVYRGAILLGDSPTGSFSIPWDTTASADGGISLTAKAYDTFGNVTTSAAVAVIVDNTPPTVSLLSPTSGANLRGTVSLTASPSDAGSGVARVDFYDGATLLGGTTAAPWSVSWNTTAVADGSHSLTARATDKAGRNTTSAAAGVVVDNTAPSIAFASPVDGSTIGGTVSLTASPGDAGSGLAQVTFYRGATLIGTATAAPWTVTFATGSVPDGAVTLTATALDRAGNSASASIGVGVDNTAPTAAITSPANGSVVVGVVTIAASASDASGVARVDFYDGAVLLGSDVSSPFSFDWNAANATDGDHALQLRAVDVVGNQTALLPGPTVRVDNLPPSVSLSAPAPGAVLRGYVAIVAGASDGSGIDHVELWKDSTLLATPTSAPYSTGLDTTAYPDGAAAIIAVAYDKAGRSSSASIPVTIDNTAPAVSLTSPANGYVHGIVSISAGASDAQGVTRVEFSVDGTLLATDVTAPYSATWNTTGLTGGHSVVATAFDAAGNSAAAYVGVSVDNVAPSAPSIVDPTGGTVAGTIDVYATASDDVYVAQMELLIDGTVVYSQAGSTLATNWDSRTVPNGSHTLSVRATDGAGNTAVSSVAIVTNNDFIPPTVTLTNPANGDIVRKNITVSATASDNVGIARVDFVKNGAVFFVDYGAPYSVTWWVASDPNGTYVLQAKAYDAAGNETDSAPVTVTLKHH